MNLPLPPGAAWSGGGGRRKGTTTGLRGPVARPPSATRTRHFRTGTSTGTGAFLLGHAGRVVRTRAVRPVPGHPDWKPGKAGEPSVVTPMPSPTRRRLAATPL
ncbi:hypothetical protein GCM10010361_67260 [Streptomyces olivaceiscleroticus]|uniref:Uncharacterized protein n=1 Tax=Streptomyces olivaceiscleroticus TaxID=68245 RepID=A0ABP3L5U4_9ACTN